MNSGTRLCSYIPKTKNVVVQEAPGRSSYVLKTDNGKRGSLKIPPAGIIDLGAIGLDDPPLDRSWRQARPLRRCIAWLEAQVATKRRKSRGWNSCHRSEDTSGAVHASDIQHEAVGP